MFGVWRWGLRVRGTGLRGKGLGFRVQGIGLRVEGFGFWDLGFGFPWRWRARGAGGSSGAAPLV